MLSFPPEGVKWSERRVESNGRGTASIHIIESHPIEQHIQRNSCTVVSTTLNVPEALKRRHGSDQSVSLTLSIPLSSEQCRRIESLWQCHYPTPLCWRWCVQCCLLTWASRLLHGRNNQSIGVVPFSLVACLTVSASCKTFKLAIFHRWLYLRGIYHWSFGWTQETLLVRNYIAARSPKEGWQACISQYLGFT